MGAMNTTTGPLDRFADWILDRDGDLYGDEQERLRWYEAITIAANAQWALVPWAVAIGVLVGGRPAVPAVMIVMGVFYLPILLANSYVYRHRVRTQPERWSRKRWILAVASGFPYLGIALALAVVYHASSSTLLGGLVGGAVGAGAAVLGLRARRRKQQAFELDESE